MLSVWPAACSSSPTAPAPVPTGYAGEWASTTGQGTPVSFSVSGEEVTSFTLAFNFSSTCSASVTSPSPMPIRTLDPPNPPPLSQEPGFGIGWPRPPVEWAVAVYGIFSPGSPLRLRGVHAGPLSRLRHRDERHMERQTALKLLLSCWARSTLTWTIVSPHTC